MLYKPEYIYIYIRLDVNSAGIECRYVYCFGFTPARDDFFGIWSVPILKVSPVKLEESKRRIIVLIRKSVLYDIDVCCSTLNLDWMQFFPRLYQKCNSVLDETGGCHYTYGVSHSTVNFIIIKKFCI